jgi:hypothetical protein
MKEGKIELKNYISFYLEFHEKMVFRSESTRGCMSIFKYEENIGRQ